MAACLFVSGCIHIYVRVSALFIRTLFESPKMCTFLESCVVPRLNIYKYGHRFHLTESWAWLNQKQPTCDLMELKKKI